jgi:hypothetical protein
LGFNTPAYVVVEVQAAPSPILPLTVATAAAAAAASCAAAAASELQRASGAAGAERLARQLQLEGQIEQMQVRATRCVGRQSCAFVCGCGHCKLMQGEPVVVHIFQQLFMVVVCFAATVMQQRWCLWGQTWCPLLACQCLDGFHTYLPKCLSYKVLQRTQ